MASVSNNNVSLKKRVYRGSTSYTVSWLENGVMDSRDFSGEQEAEIFFSELNSSNGTTKSASAPLQESWAEQTKVYCSLLKTTPEQLNVFLNNLTNLKNESFGEWVELANTSITVYSAIEALAHTQELSVDGYLNKLNIIEDEPIDDLIVTYKRYAFSRHETKRLLLDYLKLRQAEEEDEDEVRFIKVKLEKMLNAFNFDIFSINDNHVADWFSEQKGSEAAKSRLLEIVNSFRQFAIENRTEMPEFFLK